MAAEADLVRLHEKLEEGHAVRGGGGLGFEKPKNKSKAPKSKAERALARDNKREFASTTAGAIAAGHWDPWARPVEFKMKAANTKVGGLYSMFVQGGTMGGTIQTDRKGAEGTTAKPTTEKKGKPSSSMQTEKKGTGGTATSKLQTGKKREGSSAMQTDKKGTDNTTSKVKAGKKRNRQPSAAATATGDPQRSGAAESSSIADALSAFKWKREIKATLKQAPSQEMRIAELRKAVVAAADAALGAAKFDKQVLRTEFRKKLLKTANVKQEGKMVQLYRAPS